MEIKLSTVVPVYNVGKYIRTCLESLLKQGMEPGEHEILLIDDGSTDDSGRICDEYAAKYPTIFRVFHKPNGGVSSARNLGIREAKGEYIHFMDADDFLNDWVYRALVDKLDRFDFAVDFFGFQYDKINVGNGIVSHVEKCGLGDIDIISDCSGKELILSGNMICNVWSYMVHRAFLLKNHLLFRERMAPGQDTLFNFQCMTYCSRVVITSAKAYNYCVRPGSAVTYFPRERLINWIDSIVIQINGLKSIGKEHSDLKDAMCEQINKQMVYFMPKLLKFKMRISDSRYMCNEFAKLDILPLPNSNLVLKSANIFLKRPLLLPVFAMLYRAGLYSAIFRLLCVLNPSKYK